MRSLFALAVIVVCTATGAPPAQAQPELPADGSPKEAADLEFNRAREKFEAWCQQLEAAHRDAPDELRLTLRLADCRRLGGQLAEAAQLLAEAVQRRGAAALAEAQRAADAEIGRPAPTSGPEVQWAEACQHFEKSLRLDASIAAQLAVAACQLRRGELAAAREQLAACAAALAPLAGSDEFRAVQLKLAQTLLADVARLQPHIIVEARAGFGGAVAIDNRAIAAKDVVAVDPGAHRVRATLTGGRVEEATLELSARDVHTVSITRTVHRSERRQLAFWSLLGAAGVATLSAGVSLWLTQRAADDLEGGPPGRSCTRDSIFGLTCDLGVDASSFETRATLFQLSAVGAAALFGSAAIIYYTAPHRERLRVAPSVEPGAVGVSAAGRF